MFQYATGRALAERRGAPLLLDASGFEHYDLRRYELGELAINARVASPDELAAAGVVASEPSLMQRVLRRAGFGRPAYMLREASFTYDARIESATSPVYLDGYWQCERYFAPIADILRKELALKEPLDAANSALAAEIASAGSRAVSLHIRRGDYVKNAHTAQYHGVCSLDYYRAAVKHVAERVGSPHFFVFSDDHEWVQANFDIGYPTTLVQVNGADRGVCDMALMKACAHHIIANSSFSWWGAWLNPSRDKIVVAPQCWFSGASHDTSDLIPGTWVRL
ncbi:alpha-1,2-fucosyltransferase [Cupriavidus basilensis]